jgi:arylsulfatase A-like enzyme
MAAVSLPEHFHDHGYRTMISGKVYHTKPPGMMEVLWDDMENIDGGYGPSVTKVVIPDSIKRPPAFNYEAWSGPDNDFPDVMNAAVTVKRLGATYPQPFLIAHGIYRPHNPWTALRRFFDRYPLDSVVLPEVREDDLDDLPEIAKEWAHNPVNWRQLRDAGQWKPVVRAYLACISFMDETFGKLMDALDQGPNKNNTIVVVFGDNGFHLGEKEHFAKFALWELTTHELLMVRAPGVTKPGTRSTAPVSLLGLYPTLIDLCGLPQPATAPDGRSFASLVRDPSAAWFHPAVMGYGPGNFAVRDPRWRYIRYRDGTEELYDHDKDPNEWTNLASQAEHASVKARLAKHLPTKFVPEAGKDSDGAGPKGKKK